MIDSGGLDLIPGTVPYPTWYPEHTRVRSHTLLFTRWALQANVLPPFPNTLGPGPAGFGDRLGIILDLRFFRALLFKAMGATGSISLISFELFASRLWGVEW